MPCQRDAAELDRCALLAQIRYHHAFGRGAEDRTLQIIEAPEAHDRIDLAMTFQHLRTRLRQTSRHYNSRVRIQAPGAPREADTFHVGAIGYGARVNDIDVGGLVELASHEAARTESRFDYCRIVLVDFAAQCRDRETHLFKLNLISYCRSSAMLKVFGFLTKRASIGNPSPTNDDLLLCPLQNGEAGALRPVGRERKDRRKVNRSPLRRRLGLPNRLPDAAQMLERGLHQFTRAGSVRALHEAVGERDDQDGAISDSAALRVVMSGALRIRKVGEKYRLPGQAKFSRIGLIIF